MVTPEQGTATALSLAGEAARLLDDIGDRAGALRMRHAAATIRHDARHPARDVLGVPLSLSRMALALLDRDGHGTSGAAIHLQTAIDDARGARPLSPGEMIDADLLPPYFDGASPTRPH